MTTQQQLDERYGRTARSSRIATWIGVIVIVVVGVVWITWITSSGSSAQSIDADDTGFTVTDESSVEVSFRITGAHADDSVYCTLEALDEQYGIVGWKVVEIAPTDSVSSDYTGVLPTTAEANTGYVTGCRLG
ncbi:DUF4307 domain-containing protein [Microbacterium indicum]|uniref:DUF4307 domain-containing protein n=1 Tax=Microbacterium indicum TaxID=358100 RepID=UPI0004287406|nr:DUF4307 domain-containing protein [Microbacterium indicum]